MNDVYITGVGLFNSLGLNAPEVLSALWRGTSGVREQDDGVLGAPLNEHGWEQIEALRREKPLQSLDPAVLAGVLVAREAAVGINSPLESTGVIMGSSRGATRTLEKELATFLKGGRPSALTSPTTTSGSFANTVASDLGLQGYSTFVSSACSTSLQAVGLAYRMILGGQLDGAIAGGSETSFTPFTIEQLRRVRVYGQTLPYRPFHDQRDGMVIGEGAAALALGRSGNGFARVLGFGASCEQETLTGISPDALSLQRAIRSALDEAGMGAGEVSLIVGHGSGTKKGDAAELAAMHGVFGEKLPPLTFHKWATGHTLGAAGATSLGLAALFSREGCAPAVPYGAELGVGIGEEVRFRPGSPVLVTALGFGGNAAAVILGSDRG